MNNNLKKFTSLIEEATKDFWSIDFERYQYMDQLDKLLEQDGMVVFALTADGPRMVNDMTLLNHYFGSESIAYPTEWDFLKLKPEDQYAKLTYNKTFLVTDVGGRPLYMMDFNDKNGHVPYFRDTNNNPVEPDATLYRLVMKIAEMKHIEIPESPDFQPFIDFSNNFKYRSAAL